jgi:hypothetical protein
MSKNKTIIFGMPKRFKLHESFIKNMKFHGYQPISICIDDYKYGYKNIFERLNNRIRKFFLNDNEYKINLKIHQLKIDKVIDDIPGKVDFAFLIRADLYSKKIIESIKQKSNLLVGYQWDGLKRFPRIYSLTHYFNRFFVFDSADVEVKNNRLFLTNFYFDYPLPESKVNDSFDVFYIGSYVSDRINDVIQLSNQLQKANLKVSIYIHYSGNTLPNSLKLPYIKHLHHELSYEETLLMSANSNILLDFQTNIHDGLSMRLFESIRFRKKIITTNAFVKHFDFYKPENIFIWDTNCNTQDLVDFLQKPYLNIDTNLIEKYCFNNWLNYVLNIDPHIPINLPKE